MLAVLQAKAVCTSIAKALSQDPSSITTDVPGSSLQPVLHDHTNVTSFINSTAGLKVPMDLTHNYCTYEPHVPARAKCMSHVRGDHLFAVSCALQAES